MPHSRWHPPECRRCGAHRDQGAAISSRGLCGPCGEQSLADYQRALASKTGPQYEAWRAKMIRALTA